ncbi:MAG: hypothetical protein ACREV2_11790 [Burkholderiales bacterium]
MARQFAAVAAMVLVAAAYRVAGQPATTPAPDGGVSVVMSCRECGTINSIREIQEAHRIAPAGAASESPVGLVIYIPLGRPADGKDAYIGPVGSSEWQSRTTSIRYEFTVRMDDGNYRMVQKDGISDLRVGDRVVVSGGHIERWGQERPRASP